MIRARVRRVLLVCAVAAGLWTAVVWLTGGFTVRVAGVRLSSTNARPAAVVALTAALGAWWLSTRVERTAFVERCRAVFWSTSTRTADGFIELNPRIASRLAAALAVTMFVLGVWRGAPYPGGADAYGYVSQAELWLHGAVRVEEPLMHRLSWPYAKDALAPLGYVPSADGHAIVPIYPPGLPLTMAAFQLVGGRRAVFLAVPLLGAIAVWATFLLGRRLGGSLVGLVAATLVAASPVFVFQLMVPMSDVPAAAWWTLCLFLSTFTSRRAAFGTGAAAGFAVLTRPNLVALTIVPAAIVAMRPLEASRKERAGRIAAFGAAVSICGLFLAVHNWRLYGSPLLSGYGPASNYFGWHYFSQNVRQYSAWFVDAETPLALIAVALPAIFWWERRHVRRDTLVLAAGLALFLAVIGAVYAWYAPTDAWWLLRYFLAAYPPLMVLTAMALVWLAARVARRGAIVAVLVLLLLVVWHHAVFLEARGGFAFRENERKVEAIGQYAARQLPADAVFVAENFSGSLRYYTGRPTVRLDVIPPDQFDRALADLRSLGLHPYIVVDESEQESVRNRFAGPSVFGALDWQPVAWLRHSTRVYIYDPAEREHSPGRMSVIIAP